MLVLVYVAGRLVPDVPVPRVTSDARNLWLLGDDPLYERRPDGRVMPNPIYVKIDDTNDRSFRIPKEPGVFRIFCIGQSTTDGMPFNPRGGYPEWLGVYLKDLLPDCPTEVVNAGISGSDSVRDVYLVQEIMSYEPDLLVLYEGNNETMFYPYRVSLGRFGRTGLRIHVALLKNCNLYRQLSVGFQRKATQPEEGIIRRLFENNMRRIVSLSRERSVPIVFLAQVNGLTLAPETTQTSVFNDILKSQSGPHVFYADIATEFREEVASGATIVPDLLVDDVHPSLRGYQLIAAKLCRVISENGLIAPPEKWRWENIRSERHYASLLDLTDEFMAEAYLRQAHFVTLHGNRGQFAPLYLERVEKLRPGYVFESLNATEKGFYPDELVRSAADMYRSRHFLDYARKLEEGLLPEAVAGHLVTTAESD